MPGNSIGNIFTLSTFGESHGKAIGGVIDGCPPGLYIDHDFIMHELKRRSGGNLFFETPRDEPDNLEWLSGIYDKKTLGTPIAFLVYNKDKHSSDYKAFADFYRKGHADYTWQKKYGIRDHRGGGRASARETLARVVGGAIARLLLKKFDVEILAFVKQIGPVEMKEIPEIITPETIDESPLRCPDAEKTKDMTTYLEGLSNEGDTSGGIVECHVRGLSPGLGEPVFGKLHSALASAVMSIPSVKAFALGEGFSAAALKGSDMLKIQDKKNTFSEKEGGIQGGISNGQEIIFSAVFKPITSIKKEQVVLTSNGNEKMTSLTGRFDVCAVPRAVPVVEAMAALVIADYYLLNRTCKLF